NGTTFSFTYPGGSGGHLDFRTIPGLVAPGFVVTNTSPSGGLAGPVDHVHVTFSRSVDMTTFTPAQVNLTDPSGSPITITSITDTGSADHTQFDINFAAQGIAGSYAFTLSPDIQDLDGDHLTSAVGSEIVVNGGFENPLSSEWAVIGTGTFRDDGTHNLGVPS